MSDLDILGWRHAEIVHSSSSPSSQYVTKTKEGANGSSASIARAISTSTVAPARSAVRHPRSNRAYALTLE